MTSELDALRVACEGQPAETVRDIAQYADYLRRRRLGLLNPNQALADMLRSLVADKEAGFADTGRRLCLYCLESNYAAIHKDDCPIIVGRHFLTVLDAFTAP